MNRAHMHRADLLAVILAVISSSAIAVEAPIFRPEPSEGLSTNAADDPLAIRVLPG